MLIKNFTDLICMVRKLFFIIIKQMKQNTKKEKKIEMFFHKDGLAFRKEASMIKKFNS